MKRFHAVPQEFTKKQGYEHRPKPPRQAVEHGAIFSAICKLGVYSRFQRIML